MYFNGTKFAHIKKIQYLCRRNEKRSMKKVYVLMCAGLLGIALSHAQTNLIGNGSFEIYDCNAAGCSWEDWSMPFGSAVVDTEDKLDGLVAMQMYPSITANLDQGVLLSDDEYAAGTLFALTIHYKVLSLPADASIDLDCYWESAGIADAETIQAHEAEILRQPMASSVSSEWESLSLTTSKPEGASTFRVRIKVPKKAKVLFDDFSLIKTEDTAPYIHVTPSQLSSVSTTIGNEAVMQTVHIEHGHVEGTTTFELSYTDAAQFRLSQTELSADASSCDLLITYAPTTTGTHTAYLNIDNPKHPTLFRSIRLQGTCTDPSVAPSVTVVESEVPAFEIVVGQEQQETIHIRSANCTDYTYLKMEHIEGSAFTIDRTMLPKNSESEVVISFRPRQAGTFQSRLTIYSQSSEFASIQVLLNGTGDPATPETVDWLTHFQWDLSEPLSYLNETFDDAHHNKTLQLKGWQNVAEADERPWWGFEEAVSPNVEGDGKYAKATAYQWGVAQSGEWHMWLVTPALDYKNAQRKVFSFSVMGEYMPEENIEAALEIYYIDATDPEAPLFQDLTESFTLPATSEENNVWIPFTLDLTPYSQTIADVFFMAFRYVGPSGSDGAVTYYVDNVSWGADVAEGVERAQSTEHRTQTEKVLRNGQVIIRRGGKEYSILGIPIL